MNAGFITAHVDYESVAQQVKDDAGLVYLLNVLADAFAEGSNDLLLDLSSEELSLEAKQFIKKLAKEAEEAS